MEKVKKRGKIYEQVLQLISERRVAVEKPRVHNWIYANKTIQKDLDASIILLVQEYGKSIFQS